MQELLNSRPRGDFGDDYRYCRYTFWIELLGGVVLTFAFWWDDLAFGRPLAMDFFIAFQHFVMQDFPCFPTP